MCDVLSLGVPGCVTKCDRGRGSKLAKNSVTYFMDGPLCRQSDLASLIHNMGIYSTFPNVSIALRGLRLFMCLMVWNCFGERSFSWMARNKLLWQMSACPPLEFLSVESDLLDNIHVCFTDIVHKFGIAKAESICKTLAAINIFE